MNNGIPATINDMLADAMAGNLIKVGNRKPRLVTGVETLSDGFIVVTVEPVKGKPDYLFLEPDQRFTLIPTDDADERAAYQAGLDEATS